MRLIALMVVRDEEWCIGLSARAALQWCDALAVIEHACTDKTDEILHEVMGEFPGRIRIHEIDQPTWLEMELHQCALELGRQIGGTHFALIDADEVLSGNLVGKPIRDVVKGLPAGGCLDVPMIAPWRGMDVYRDDQSAWSRTMSQIITVAFADAPGLGWAAAQDGYQLHSRAPREHRARTLFLNNGNKGGCLHLQWADWDRLVWKHRRYKMFEALTYPGRSTAAELNAKYGLALDEAGLVTVPMPGPWLEPYWRWMGAVDLTSPPWHRRWCEAAWARYGADVFRGLDLWGWPS